MASCEQNGLNYDYVIKLQAMTLITQ